MFSIAEPSVDPCISTASTSESITAGEERSGLLGSGDSFLVEGGDVCVPVVTGGLGTNDESGCV